LSWLPHLQDLIRGGGQGKHMRMISRCHRSLRDPGPTGEIRFINKLFELAA
jgi:hypothetical protein